MAISASPSVHAMNRTLLADIGGTSARFAVLDADRLGPIDCAAVSGHPSIESAVAAFLDKQASPIAHAILGIAGPVAGGRCLTTNSRWIADGNKLRAAFGFASVDLVNDFETIARALPHLRADDVRPLTGGEAVAGEPMAVIGPGTGLGMAALLCDGSIPTLVATEGGHATLAGANPREDAVIAHLRGRFGHASAERALSGPGLENLYAAIAAIDQVAPAQRDAVEITRLALDRRCATSLAAVDMFCAMLGTVAGNLALTFRARGGIFIAGGIVPRLVDHLAQSEFRARFVAKGRFRDFLETIPTTIIVNPDVAFLGLAAIAHTTSAR
jgi:glucokinase